MWPDTEQPSYNKPAVAPSALTDGLAAAHYKAALEEIWTTYINAGEREVSAGTLAYIAKDALAANAV